MDEVEVEVVHPHPVQAVHQVLLDELGADPDELLVEHPLAVDELPRPLCLQPLLQPGPRQV